MKQGLFRKEALEARRTNWLGGMLMSHPVPTWVLTAGALVATSCIVLFLVFGTYARRTHVIGQLVPTKGLATVLAPATGVVEEVTIPADGRIVAGQRLAIVAVQNATVASGDTARALEQRLQRRQDGLVKSLSAQDALLDAQAGGLEAQLATARRERAQAEAEIQNRQAQVDIAAQTLERLRELRARQYVSELQVREQQAAVLRLESEVHVLRRQAAGLERLVAQIEQGLREIPEKRESAAAAYERDRALLEQERVETEARSSLAVLAPVAGVLATQLAKPGQSVQAGQPLLTVLPSASRLEAELLVPSRAIGFVDPGDQVLLRYQAYPYQKFGHHRGRVVRVSRSALGANELRALLVGTQAAEPLYRVTVAISRQTVTAYGSEEPLRPGMLLDAEVLGERRSLIAWVFEPLYSLKGFFDAT